MLDRDQMTRAFNEWMRRYTDEPARFALDFKTVIEYLKESGEGKQPNYGQTCSAYMLELTKELENRPQPETSSSAADDRTI